MEIKKRSTFKDPEKDLHWFKQWAAELAKHNHRQYQSIELNTALGKTQVWGLNLENTDWETLVIFPGARTTALFWDFDRGLDQLGHQLRIYLVETNGLPNLSDGNTPDIRSLDYGEWAQEVLEKLNLERCYIAGASFGGLIGLKLGIVAPEKIKAVFLLNPGCLQDFSLTLKNLYYNLLPIFLPNPKNVSKFLDAAVFCKPTHQLSPAAEKLIIDYEVFALTRYQDKTEKPYYMAEQLEQVKAATYLLEGDKDLLFPFEKSIQNAQAKLRHLKDVKIFPNVGHGIETYAEAMKYIGDTIKCDTSI